MAVNQTLLHSQWSVSGRYGFQVIPHAKNPGRFTARVIVGNQGLTQPATLELMRQAANCEAVTAGQIFFENPEAESNKPLALIGNEAISMIPGDLAEIFQPAAFSDGLKLFSIQPSVQPAAPAYEFWTRDFVRSVQVVDGKYTEIIPYSFEFVPTLNCVFRCEQCAYRPPKESMGVWERNIFSPQFHMDLASMRILLDRIKATGATEVLFTGGGEPLLNRATPDAMNYAGRILGLKVGLYTNGVLVTEKKAQAIIGANPAYARVSSNAGNKETYMQHHHPLKPGVDYFLLMQKGTENLARAKQAQGSKTVLGISYLVDPGNAHDAVNGARLIAEIAGRYPGMINYMRFTPSVNYFGPDQHPPEVFSAALEQMKREVVPMLTAAGVEASIYYHRFSGLYETKPYDRCLAHGWYGGVGPGGFLYLCCEKMFNPKFAFGSLLEHSFDELWNGDQRRQVLEFASHACRGETDCPCPVVCKPNEHNKVFNEIERLRAAGKIDIVRAWLEQIHQIVATSQSQTPARLFGFSAKPS